MIKINFNMYLSLKTSPELYIWLGCSNTSSLYELQVLE